MRNEQDHRASGDYFWPVSAALYPKNVTDGQMAKLQGQIKTNLFLYLNSWESTQTRSTTLHLARWDARKNKNLQVHLHWFPFLLLFLEQCLTICFTMSIYVFVRVAQLSSWAFKPTNKCKWPLSQLGILKNTSVSPFWTYFTLQSWDRSLWGQHNVSTSIYFLWHFDTFFDPRKSWSFCINETFFSSRTK